MPEAVVEAAVERRGAEGALAGIDDAKRPGQEQGIYAEQIAEAIDGEAGQVQRRAVRPLVLQKLDRLVHNLQGPGEGDVVQPGQGEALSTRPFSRRRKMPPSPSRT